MLNCLGVLIFEDFFCVDFRFVKSVSVTPCSVLFRRALLRPNCETASRPMNLWLLRVYAAIASRVVFERNYALFQAITQNMRRRCRCHGVSGSCEFQTCWLEMPKFSEVGEMLKQRYNYFAVQVGHVAENFLTKDALNAERIDLRAFSCRWPRSRRNG